MRVIGGNVGGLNLKGPVDKTVRPTTERVRSAIFNIIAPEQYVNGRTLDLFAGTGSLGIETLSRGASHCDFVERNSSQLKILRDNLAFTGFTGQSKAYRLDILKGLGSLKGPYDMVLMDPPYKMAEISEFLVQFSKYNNIFDERTLIVVGHSKRMPLRESYDTLHCVDSRSYGDNAIKLYECREG